MKENLSEHDHAIVEKMESLKKKHGSTAWVEIQRLYPELKDIEEQQYWDRVCSRLYHIDEYYAGLL